jgi:hypothetical protein
MDCRVTLDGTRQFIEGIGLNWQSLPYSLHSEVTGVSRLCSTCYVVPTDRFLADAACMNDHYLDGLARHEES